MSREQALAANHELEKLYKDHHGWLHGWLRSRLACSHQAADLAQDTFVRLLGSARARQELTRIREPRSFLATVARRVMVDWIRRSAIERAYLETLAAQSEPGDLSPEAREMIIETLLEIDVLLDDLGARTREIFLLAQIDGLSYVEIGRRLNLSVTTVRKHFIRAITGCLALVEN